MAASSSSARHGLQGTNAHPHAHQEKELEPPPRWKPARGDLIWFPDAKEYFKQVAVYEVTDDEKIKTELGIANLEDCYPACPPHQDGVPDNTMLMYLHDPNMLHNLRFRYDRDQIYTYTANILIAINPYKTLDMYSAENMARYHAGTPHAMEPHVFGIAERCYRYMRAHKRDQSIVVSGDSGAGKTESCKYMMRYLCTVAGRGVGDLENRILEANPILEAFGNAKTLRNVNSSRFGKFVEIYFDGSAMVSGAAISTYLLEKSRLVNQAEGERNFHVFYQLLASGKADMLAAHGLRPDPALYHYTNRSTCVTVAGVDDAAEFNHLVQAMSAVGISAGAQALVWQTLAGLLHLGNIRFDAKDVDDEDAEESVIDPDSDESVTLACKAFGCTPDNLKACLLTRTMQSGSKRGSIFTIPLRPRDAAAARDSLAKGIYGRLFDWLVKQVNAGLPRQVDGDKSISILDISGFEHFDHNGFEQFLINTCNEKIQQYFITQIMKQEQDIYAQEGLRWKKVKYNDNFDTIQLLEKKRTGIMALLEESCLMPRATDVTFTRKVHQVQSDHPSLMRPTACPKTVAGQPRKYVDDEAYVVRHFAADVCYSTKHFLAKNNDTLHQDLANLVQAQSGVFLKSLFAETADDRGSQRFGTVSANFMRGLETLMERLHQTDSSFVRCVNPNLLQKPGLINASSVMTQLRCSGMLEALEILQAGFPTRCLFTDLYSKYRSFMPEEIQNLKPVLFCEALLVAHDLVGGADFQMGLSRVFFRAGKLAFMEELLSSSPAKVEEIVRKVRMWLARKRWKQSVWAVISINLLAKIIADIREAKRLAEEKRRLESEEYQAELRRRQEEVLRRQQEERMRREEEERREREAREARHREKMEARRREQEEMKRLRNEAAAKLDLENQLQAERQTYVELEQHLRDDLSTLEEALVQEREEKSALRTQLEDQKTQNALLQQSQKDLSDELQRLRDRIAELEHQLALANARIKALQDKLDKERTDTEQVVADLENDLLDLADQKDRELAKCRKECDEAIALMRAEMEATIEKIQKAADARVQEAMTEKTKAIQQVTVEKDQQIQILEKTSTKPLKTGFLWKRGGRSSSGTWQKRHFVLKSNFLAYYRQATDPKPVGLIDLESSRVYKAESKKSKKPGKKEKPNFEFELAVPDRTYYIKAENDHDLEEWMKAINLAKARHLASVTLNLDQTSVNTARKINVQQIRQSVAVSPRRATGDSEAASSSS